MFFLIGSLVKSGIKSALAPPSAGPPVVLVAGATSTEGFVPSGYAGAGPQSAAGAGGGGFPAGGRACASGPRCDSGVGDSEGDDSVATAAPRAAVIAPVTVRLRIWIRPSPSLGTKRDEERA
jgi:hypothetical protein